MKKEAFYYLFMFSDFINLVQSHLNSFKPLPNNLPITLGCSFDPYHQIFFEQNIKPIEVLKYLNQELGINNIRIGLRWDMCVDEKGAVSLNNYREYLDYLKERKIEVVVNLGPIKVMRWPEEHIPEDLKKFVKRNQRIGLKSEIADYALEYLSEILELVKKEDLNIYAIQGDNELFNPFGQFQTRISMDFESKTLEIIKRFYPDCKIFVNSAGLNDFKKIFKLVDGLNNKIILGLNYYYKTTYHHRIPFINLLDFIFLRRPFTFSASHLKKQSTKKGYTIEVSELQGEPWWPNALQPGNSFRWFKFSVLRSNFLKPKDQDKILLRYWGIEDFVSKFLLNLYNQEHNLIKEFIINTNDGNKY